MAGQLVKQKGTAAARKATEAQFSITGTTVGKWYTHRKVLLLIGVCRDGSCGHAGVTQGWGMWDVP
jgi:hypothetical protein